MKKLFALFLALILCMSLCACKSDEVIQTEALIDAIGTVTPQSEAAIREAEAAFAALPEKQWKQVENAQTLIDARTAFMALFTTVDITAENWSEYFELAVEPQWRENAGGEVVQLREVKTFRVKDAYKDRIIPAETRLTMHFDINSAVHPSTVDWANRSYTMGDASAREVLHPGTASFAWPGTATTDAREAAALTNIHIGYSVLSDVKSDAPETRLFVYDHTLSGIEGSITILTN